MVGPSRLAQEQGVIGEMMWKLGGMTLNDSREIPRGPCVGPSESPAVPQNPT
jgi:hypothetical protein